MLIKRDVHVCVFKFLISVITTTKIQEKSRTEAALNAKIAQYDEDMASRYVTPGFVFEFV